MPARKSEAGWLAAPYAQHVRSNKTPQDKKRLTLERDGRNAFGENDKASRKNIPRAKARVNRANRRADTVALDGALGVPDEDLDSAAEDAVKGRRRKVWRKWPDEPLGRQLARREGTEDELPWDPSQSSWH